MGVHADISATDPDDFLAQYWKLHDQYGGDPRPAPFWWDAFQEAGGTFAARSNKEARWYKEFVEAFMEAKAKRPGGVVTATMRWIV